MRGRLLLLYSLCCLIWGSTWLVIKIGLSDFPPFEFAALRMGIACVVLAPIAFRRGLPPLPLREWGAVAFSGFLQIGLSYAFVFAAEAKIDSGLTAILFSSFPIWVGLFAHAMLPGEPLTRAQLTAALFGLLGVAVLELPVLTGLFRGGGIGWAAFFPVASALTSALSNVWIKRHLGRVSPAVNLWGQTLVGSLFLFSLSLLLEGNARVVWSPKAIGALLYLSIPGTVIAFLALLWLIPRVPMATIGVIPLIDTLIAVLLGILVLGEPFGWRIFAGGAMILGGAALALRSRDAAPVSVEVLG
ncbi:MAG: DMT family transporter [Thermoanaerobaculia bacterium]